MNKLTEFVVGVCITIIALSADAFMSGWIMAKLWVWFIVPVLLLPQFSIVQFVGFILVIKVIIHGNSNVDKEKKYIDRLVFGTFIKILDVTLLYSMGLVVKYLFL